MIAPDLRGFGQTDKPGEVGDYRMRTAVGDAVGLLDALGVDRAAVVGHGWGAGGGLDGRDLRARPPDRLNRLLVEFLG